MEDINAIYNKFIEAAAEAVQEDNHPTEFICPLCGGAAVAARATNGSLHAQCNGCDTLIMQ